MKNTFLPLSDEDKKYLKSLSKTRTIQAQVVDRARILLYKADGVSFDDIAARLNISKRTVRLCISKFNTGGLDRITSYALYGYSSKTNSASLSITRTFYKFLMPSSVKESNHSSKV